MAGMAICLGHPQVIVTLAECLGGRQTLRARMAAPQLSGAAVSPAAAAPPTPATPAAAPPPAPLRQLVRRQPG